MKTPQEICELLNLNSYSEKYGKLIDTYFKDRSDPVKLDILFDEVLNAYNLLPIQLKIPVGDSLIKFMEKVKRDRFIENIASKVYEC